MQHSIRRKLSVAFVVALTCAAFTAIGTSNASAAATINATTSSDVVDASVAVDIQTTLTGSGNAKRQWGAKITLPGEFWLNFPAVGTSAQMCSPSTLTYSPIAGSLTPNAFNFNKATCPSTAKIGTVSLGSTSGGLYIINTSPMPTFGAYFDTGTATPYGRRVAVTWGSGYTDLLFTGLAKASTSGLRVVIGNPSRPTLPANLFRWTPAGGGVCSQHPQVTGNVWTYPTSGTAATNTAAAPAELTLNGCEDSFVAEKDSDVAEEETALHLDTTVEGRLYGATFKIPGLLGIFSHSWGAPTVCPVSSFSSLATGLTPIATNFNKASCPAGAQVGTAKLGSATGHIYVVNSTPMPNLGVYFDSGVATPYGRKISVNWGPEGYGETNLLVFGLQGEDSYGLELDFDRPSNQLWTNDPAEGCDPQDAESKLYKYPESGTSATPSAVLTSELNITDC